MSKKSNTIDHVTEYVAVYVGSQLFGLPIESVQDVFVPGQLTRVPLAGDDIAGILNLRGRIVTAIDMRWLLGLSTSAAGIKSMAVGIEVKGESYGLVVDSVGEVMKLSDNIREQTPANLDARLARVAAGVYRLEDQLLIILDVGRILDLESVELAA